MFSRCFFRCNVIVKHVFYLLYAFIWSWVSNIHLHVRKYYSMLWNYPLFKKTNVLCNCLNCAQALKFKLCPFTYRMEIHLYMMQQWMDKLLLQSYFWKMVHVWIPQIKWDGWMLQHDWLYEVRDLKNIQIAACVLKSALH